MRKLQYYDLKGLEIRQNKHSVPASHSFASQCFACARASALGPRAQVSLGQVVVAENN